MAAAAGAGTEEEQIQEWLYVTRPGTEEVSSKHYRLEKRAKPKAEDLQEGEVFFKTLFCSVDPYQRIQQAASDTWEAPHALGKVQGSGTVLQVEASRNAQWPVGAVAVGYTGWASHVLLTAEQAQQGLRSLQPLLELGVPLSYALGILGMPARTAYFGLLEAGKPKAGETVVVSGAAGAVGCIVVQIAKIHGCRVVAIASSQEKLEWLASLGADALINYTEHPDQASIKAALASACPGGIDIYWDNVGGYITDAVFELINLRARIIICGQITQYNGGLDEPLPGPRFLHRLIYTRATIQGILARDYNDRMPEMLATISDWLREGKISYRETVVDGFDQLPDALNSLFHSKNTGKMIVRLAPYSPPSSS